MTHLPITVEKDETTGKYILRYDASLHKVSGCKRKVWYISFRGLTREGKDFKMEYGTAFHKFLQGHYSGKPLQQNLDAAVQHYMSVYVPEDDFRNVAHLMNCCMQYVEWYKKMGDLIVPDKDGEDYMLEGKFSFPFYKTAYVEVLLDGTMDFIGTYAGQFKCVVDHKTTALTQIDSYLASYCLSPQLMTYKMIHDKLFGGDVATLINGIFLSRSNKNTFRRSSLYTYNKRQMELYEQQLTKSIIGIVEGFEMLMDAGTITDELLDSAFPPNYAMCEEKYGMCGFLPCCSMSSHDEAEGIIMNEFVTRKYDPLQFQT